MGFISPLRFQGLFNNPQEYDPYEGLFGVGIQQENPYDDLFESSPLQIRRPRPNMADLMAEYYTPETAATEHFNQLMSQYPVRQNPSTLRRIGTMLAGLGAHNTPERQEQMLYAPHERAVADWKTQVTPAYQAANLERYSNANERQLASQMATSQLNRDKLDETIRNNTANTEIKQQRADVYEWKAKHPLHKEIRTKGGNVMLFDPLTNEVYDTGVPSGTMTEENKIAAQGEEARKTVGARGEEARKTKGTPGAAATKPKTATEIRMDRYNKAAEFKDTNPELGQFVHVGESGSYSVSIDPPSDHWYGHRGPTKEQYEQIKGSIYGDLGSSASSTNQNSTSGRNKPLAKRNKNTGEVIYSYDGGKTWGKMK